MNLYATPGMVKAQIDKQSSIDDGHLLRVLIPASRLIDEASGKFFYPKKQALVLDAPDSAWPGTAAQLWLPQPLLAVESVQLSADHGRTWSYTLSETDYWLSDGALPLTPYQLLCLDPYGDYPSFYAGPRSVKVTGIWGWRRDYGEAWAALDAVQEEPLTAWGTSLTVADANGVDEWGLTPRFAVGQLLRIESEFVAVTGVAVTVDEETEAETSVLTVRRGQNGTTAAQHAQGTAVEVWRPEPVVTQATITQAARTFKRGLGGFEDASANAELGQVMYVKRLDPDVQVMLYEAGLRRVTI